MQDQRAGFLQNELGLVFLRENNLVARVHIQSASHKFQANPCPNLCNAVEIREKNFQGSGWGNWIEKWLEVVRSICTGDGGGIWKFIDLCFGFLKQSPAQRDWASYLDFFWCTIVDVEFWIRPTDHMVQCSELSFFNLLFWRCISDARLSTKEFLYVICFWKLLQVTFVLRKSLALPCWFWKLSAFSSNFKCPENLSILFIQERKIKNENIFYAKSK